MIDYTWDLHHSVDAADFAAYEETHQLNGDPFSDPRFLRAVEQTMSSLCRLWFLTVRDESGAPVAWATLSLFRVDLTVVATARAKWVVKQIRRTMPSFLRLKVIFCGIPVSAGQCNLKMAPTAEPTKVLAALDRVMLDLAAREHTAFLCHKEFSDLHKEWVNDLVTAGYLRADTPPMYYFPPHSDFPSYLAALNAHYRQDIRRSMRKAERAGVEFTRLDDPDTIAQRYDPDLHDLYLAVVERSKNQLELLPREFFQVLVRQFPGQVGLTVATIADRVAAFNWSLSTPSAYYLLFCGIDYQKNAESDLYFNLMYTELAYAMGIGVGEIHMGQTADIFKARVGCKPQSRFICVKSRYRPITRVVKALRGLLLPPVPSTPTYHIYKKPPQRRR